MAQPLVVLHASEGRAPARAPFEVGAERAVVTALRSLGPVRGFVVRLYNPGILEDVVRIEGRDGRPVDVYRSDLDHSLLEALDGPLALGSYEIVTLRILPGDGEA